MKIVPDTSVIVDGRITALVDAGELEGFTVIIPEPVVAELEYQANAGHESGISGLDEIVQLQHFHKMGKIILHFSGDRPTFDQTERAGEIDALIRRISEESGAVLYTSDRLQAHIASAKGLQTHYIRPEQETGALAIKTYFDDDVMSIHLREGCIPSAKRGKPGNFSITSLGHKRLQERDLETLSREIIEAAKRDKNSFIEIERKGVSVVQLEAMRVVIARPPFSDRFEITAT